MRSAFGIGQPHIQPNQITSPPNTAFDDIADAELTTDLLHVDRLALESKSGAAGDHKSAGNPQEIGSQVLGDPIGESFLLRIIREIRKGQHDDREPRQNRWSAGLVGIFLLARLADETDALADDRADQSLLLAIVADYAARGVDAAGEGRFRNDPPTPHRSQQIVLADDAIAVSDQENQEIEYLWLYRQPRGSPAKVSPIGIEDVIFKPKQQLVARAECSARRRPDHLNPVWTREKSRRSQHHINAASKRGRVRNPMLGWLAARRSSRFSPAVGARCT